MPSRQTIDYVYILGASHSGSTLLAMLLNAHPELVTIGESAPGGIGDIQTYRCSCGRRFVECGFWKEMADRLRRTHFDFSLEDFGTSFRFPSSRLIDRVISAEHRGVIFESIRDKLLRLSPRWRNKRQEIAANCRDLAAAAMEITGARMFVDSSKLAHRLKFLLQIRELNIKVIHLVRDGRGVALTYMRQDEFADAKAPGMRRGGRGEDGLDICRRLSMEQAAIEWQRCICSAEHLLSRLAPEQWIRVSYEDMCRSPRDVIHRLLCFLGQDPDRWVEDFRSCDHHVIGNGMRLDSTSETQLDERWRSVLTDRQLREFDRMGGDLNRRYGYS